MNPSQRRAHFPRLLEPRFFIFILIYLLCKAKQTHSLILTGSKDAYARYPKWAQTFENQLSFEFKTRSENALLLYTDDGGVQGNFYCLTIVDGHIQLDFRLGDEQDTMLSRPVHTLRLGAITVSDGNWHRFILFQAWENIKLQVDDAVEFKILTQRSFVFGNLRTNSDVFIGGIPKDIHLLSTMSSPLRRHTKKYAGSLKNLVYRLYPQGVSSPQLIDSFGTRLTDDDYCMEAANSVKFCKNMGSCYSTNDGPKCECPSDFEGRQCEKAKPSSELSFYGNEWIGYDVSNSSSASVLSRSENVSLQFKTKNQNGLLFVAGDRQNFVQLVLERGVLIAASKLFGSDKRIIRQRFSQGLKPVRYDDGKWHTVFLHRNLHMMRLTVDGNTDEVKQFASQTEWLGNSFAYVGGTAIGKAYVPPYNYMFKGCMKQIKYEADVQSLDIIDLADQGFGKSVIRTGGDLAFSCQESANALPDVLSFSTTGQSFITLPKWSSLSSGSLGFQFRTTSSDGLILYHGVKDVPLNGSSDYIAFELSDGHLFMVLDLGSGYIRLQTTSKRVNEGSVWHSVILERVGRQGSVIVDTIKTDFSTPGVSANLIIDEPIYLGAFPWPPTPNSAWNYSSILPLPSTIWSGHLRQGYVGCLKNLRINGINTQIGSAFLNTPSRNTTGQQTPVDGISLGCTSTGSQSSASAEAIDYCADSPCKNFGRCVNSFKTFECDCSLTVFDGPTCEKSQPPISLALLQDQQPLFRLETPTSSQAEMLEIKFRTTDEDLVLLDTRAEGGPDRWLLFLHNGELMLALHFGNGAKHTFSWSGKRLNDNHWHTARVKRRGVKLQLFLDGKWEHSHFLPENDMSLVLHDIAPGQALRQVIDVNVNPPLELFTEKQKPSGDVLKLIFNQYDVLDKIRSDNADIAVPIIHPKILPNKGKLKQNAISFETEKGFAQFKANFRNNADFKLSTKFKTIAHNGLLLALVNNETTKIGEHNIVLSVEMIRGRLRYRFGQTTVVLPTGDKRMNDMKWHTISIEEDSTEMTSHKILLDNEEIRIRSTPYDFSGFNGWVLVGGFPENFVPAKPHGLATVSGFKGCFSLLKIAQQQLSLLSDNVSSKDLAKGCQGPDVRCAPSLCQNNGQCHQGWRGVRCDCSETAHSGRYCEKPATSYEFDGKETSVYYEYVGPQPNTINDALVLAFRTQSSNGVLFGVQCSVDGDYLTVFVGGGYVQVRYNLGSKDHHVGYFDTLVNDGHEHLLKLSRVRSNLTLVLDELPAVNYQSNGKSELFTLNSQKYLTVGAAFNLLHSAQVVTLRKKRADLITYDEFTGEIFGVTFNGIQVLELFAQGHPNAHALGHPRLIKMAAKTPAFDPADFPQDSIRASGIGHQPKHDEEDGFFEPSELGCLDSAEHGDCEADIPTEGFFTPIVPKAFKQKNKQTDDAVSTTRWLETTTQASRQKLRTIQTDTTTTVPLFAVRPTTPMGELITTTTKAPIVTTDFPRTALISIASVSVIIIIAFVVFCVFRCRQSAPPSETTYPMAYNGVKQPSIGMGNVMLGSGNHGYTPIPSEMSPPAQHAQQFGGMSPRVNYETMNGAATLPSALRRPNGLTNGGPQPNGLGYQTIGQNQHIVNQNGQTSPARTNGNVNGGMNGGSRTWGREKKKDFKEWYV